MLLVLLGAELAKIRRENLAGKIREKDHIRREKDRKRRDFREFWIRLDFTAIWLLCVATERTLIGAVVVAVWHFLCCLAALQSMNDVLSVTSQAMGVLANSGCLS